MPSIINALTASGGGVAITGDATGNLALQTAGNTAVTIDTSQNVGIGTSSPTNFAGYTTVDAFNSGTGAVFLVRNSTKTGQFVVDTNGVRAGARTNDFFSLVTNDTERMRIDSAGRVTMPSQIGFAYVLALATVVSGNYVALSNGTTNYDVGSMLNLTGGPSSSTRVTVPIAGNYFVCLSIMGYTDATRVEMIIRKNGSDLIASNSYSAQYNNAVVCAIVNLAANDYLDIYKASGTIYTVATNPGIHYSVRLMG